MTKPSDFILKPWVAALSLGVTVGGWALLARQMMAQPSNPSAPATAAPITLNQSASIVLPPVPTVEALYAYAATNAGAISNLPPVPVVIEPAPRPQIIQAPAAAAPQTPPVAHTGSSK